MIDQPKTELDFQAQSDLHAIAQAREIEQDPSRLQRARTFAERERDRLAEVVGNLPGRQRRPFNGALRDSKMASK